MLCAFGDADLLGLRPLDGVLELGLLVRAGRRRVEIDGVDEVREQRCLEGPAAPLLAAELFGSPQGIGLCGEAAEAGLEQVQAWTVQLLVEVEAVERPEVSDDLGALSGPVAQSSPFPISLA
ncbi:hypothetical protein [Brachybacterium kimchii]|uniref:Uncharacterized protein n=1 Tax=Brachybacterium kimchii TaxID=2942909 RepID=A0ABY4NB45_9MICO|nr:hypothetical protein [Brachybacterium kimchii]UQN30653.1 hypothetical protein M4486_04950 [Brachybacterium kimchii]